MKIKTKLPLIVVLLINITLVAQDGSALTGTVVDAENVPIPGENIVIANTTTGTATDFDGIYEITVNDGDVLQFSYIGFVTESIPYEGQETLNITMLEDAAKLDEVIVVGYGTQKSSTVTRLISKVQNEKLDQIAVVRADETLIGQVSGVNIQATSAEAGAAPTITVRGIGSVSADSGPAVVVDGVIVSSDFLGTLNMNDVESFEILKDAASAAIYGSEGSNGVIKITTKSGKSGKTQFSYETYTGRRWAFGSDDYRRDLSEWAAKELVETGTLTEETQYAQLVSAATGLDRDWQDVFFDGGLITSHSFSARGGTENTTFSSSLRYLHDEGVVLTDDYKLYTASLKADSKLTDKLRFGLSVTPSYTNRRALPESIHNPIRQSPWLSIYHTEESFQFGNRDDPDDSFYFPDVEVGNYFREGHLRNLDFADSGNVVRYTAEAKFLSAYAYFNLVRLFVDVPLVTFVVGPEDDQAPLFTRVATTDVYAQIVADLQEAVGVLDNTYKSRASRAAAQGLLSKVYLAQPAPSYTGAQQLTEAIINSEQFDLRSDFNTNFCDELNDEIIFAIQYESGNTQESEGFSAEFTSGVRRQGGEDGQNIVTPNLISDFELIGGNRTAVSYVTFSDATEVAKFLPVGTDLTASPPSYGPNPKDEVRTQMAGALTMLGTNRNVQWRIASTCRTGRSDQKTMNV